MTTCANPANPAGRVGSYAISTVSFDSWANEPPRVVPAKKKRGRGVKEVVHPIFAECAQLTTDPFWVEKFNQAAIGKFPPKFGYRDGIFVFKRANKSETMELSDNVYEAMYATMAFFQSKGLIFSPSDEQLIRESQEAQHRREMNLPPATWVDINKKTQECMISYYILELHEIMGLSLSEKEQLRQTIRVGISNNFFGKHNIQVNQNRIHTIGGLLWDGTKRIFYIDPELKPVVSRSYSRKKGGETPVDPAQRDMIPQFEVKWGKYLDALQRKIQKSSRGARRATIIQDQSRSSASDSNNTTTDCTTDEGTGPFTDE
jgi:hypothetical protein